MKYEGINFENVKNNNRSAILHLLNNEGPMSRKDISQKTGLTAASVTLICADLLEEKILVELGEAVEEKRAGRKKILVDINPVYRYILCFTIESDETYISATDIKGNILGSSVLTTDKDAAPEDFLDILADEAKKILWECNITKTDVLGAAVSVPGVVDREHGISVNTYSIWSTRVPIGDILSEKLDIPIVVENNLKSSADCENLFGIGKTAENFLLVKWGPGVGSAMVINHRYYQGASGVAGELGHVTLGRDGRPCNCGRTGCLETEISTHALMRDIKEEYGKQPEDFPQLTDWLNAGNHMNYLTATTWAAFPEMERIMEDKLDKLAFSLRNYAALFDPHRIILIGYMFDADHFYDRFVERYHAYDSNVPEDYFTTSKIPERVHHIENLATALLEWFY